MKICNILSYYTLLLLTQNFTNTYVKVFQDTSTLALRLLGYER